MISLMLGPSGSGKGVRLANMILFIYKGCFNRIYIFSPSIDIDHTWNLISEYIAKEIKPYEKETYKLSVMAQYN